MQYLAFISLALSLSGVIARPAVEKRAACTSPVTLSGSTNPFTGRTLAPTLRYSKEVTAAVATITDATLKAKAQKVASVGSFYWADTISAISAVDAELKNVGCDQVFGLVVYDLPGRDCAAKASNGELAVGSIDRYKTEYVDALVTVIKANPNTAVVAIVEPDSLPNLVTNSNLTTCQQSASGYREGVAYALKSLNLPNVITYLDAGHGGWLGWDANLAPGAKELASAWTTAGSPANFRGVSTNVAGWNAWEKTPGEFENTPDGQYNKAQDEHRYVTLFGAALASAGAPNHAIVDTGRNAVQGLRAEWGDWCNVKGAGFGVRPTATTGEPLADAFVWVKPGGESDGTSDSSATRYDSFCGKSDAFTPSPEAGSWNEAYFEQLLQNAVPAF